MVLPDLNFSPPEEGIIPEDQIAGWHVLQEEHDVHMDGQEEQDVQIDVQEEQGGQRAVRHRKSLSDGDRFAAYVAMHFQCMKNGGKFDRNDKKDIASFFKVDIQIIQRIWKTAMRQMAEGLEVDVSSKRKGRCGRKSINIDLSKVLTVPLNKRSTIRSLAWQLAVSPSTLFRRFTMKLLKRQSSTLKPALKEKNKKERLQFCMSMIDERTRKDATPKFTNMHNMVHIDEKWFYMTKKDRNYYLLPEEDVPIRAVHNTNCIGKVMFLTAVARPRFDDADNVTFEGKIGIWPFVKEIPAARRSDNRPKGTLEIKSIKVNREVMREFIIEKVLPAIIAAWPANDVGQTILIQQDNATPHILPSDQAFKQAVVKITAKTGLTMKLIQQPANSPDLNVLDLGFFRSIQSLTETRSPKTLQDFIQGVQQEFEEYEVSKLNKIFLSLQTCMIQIMNHGGGNGYDPPHVHKERLEEMGTPHVHKERLERLGLLPKRLKIPAELYAYVKQILQKESEQEACKQATREQDASEEATSDKKQRKKRQREKRQVQEASQQATSEKDASEEATSDKKQEKKRQREKRQVQEASQQATSEKDASEEATSDKKQEKKGKERRSRCKKQVNK